MALHLSTPPSLSLFLFLLLSSSIPPPSFCFSFGELQWPSLYPLSLSPHLHLSFFQSFSLLFASSLFLSSWTQPAATRSTETVAPGATHTSWPVSKGVKTLSPSLVAAQLWQWWGVHTGCEAVYSRWWNAILQWALTRLLGRNKFILTCSSK